MEINVYEKFIKSLRESRTKAVEAFYQTGYVTKEEAEELKIKDWTVRNGYTTIFIKELEDDVIIFCYEDDNNLESNTLFLVSFNKHSGVVKQIE